MAPRFVFDKRRIILAGTSLAALTLAGAAHAGPTGGSVSAGSASIAGDGTGHVTVTQTSDRAILDWNSFSIGTGESTRFIQPGSTSVAVNRVTGADPSSILGNLSANGRVVLINRNGIAFGKDATVDVGGLVATTADIDRQAFMATGALNFSGGSLPGASIVNEGRITVRDAGFAALVAPRVRNSGTIVANLGRVALGAGTGFSVDFYGDGLVSFAPDGIVAATIGDGGAALVEHSGIIEASGGKVLLSAASAREVVNASVNVSGVVRADGISHKGGSIVLSGSGSVTANGRITADSDKQAGGTIAISGGSVSLGGLISASGTDGGAVSVDAQGLLSLAENVAATGRLGNGGTIRFDAGRIIETATSRNDASGAIDGGAIRVVTKGGLATSGTYTADGVYGRGGQIDLSGDSVSLLSTHIGARGRLAGGLVRIGGAFQGDKSPDLTQTYHSTFLGRWGALEALPNADTLFVGNAAAIDVSSARGDGGTAVFWSDTRTTFLGSVDARGGRGGSVEISSAGDLRQAALDRVMTGAGGHLLLDPKNIVIGTVDDVEGWQYAAILGAVYANSSNPDVFENTVGTALDTFDSFGSSVALNAAGTRMAVGSSGDDGADNATTNVGAVYLFSFSDGNFSNGTLTGIVGKGYTGGKNVDVAQLVANDAFGTSVALNAVGDLLAVGALGDDGKNEDASGSGAAYLLRFSDANFSGGTHVGTIGKGYNGAGDITSNAGAMLISGTGGASTGPQNYGVHIHDGATIASTGTGNDAATIDVIGAAGGTGSGATNIGVYIAETGAAITSIDGDISVTGTGAAASTSNNNIGVRLINDARIQSTGTTSNAATITVIGNAGGTGALSANNQGVSLQGAAATITSAFGDIAITGRGSLTSGNANNHGIHILEGAHITSTGTTPGAAKIALTGQGGGDAASATANTNIGIYLSSSNTFIESIVGDVTMTGTGGAGSNGVDAHHYGIQLGFGTQVRSTGSDADAADIILSGTGGSGTGNKRHGVYLNALDALESDAGNIFITARGGVSAGGTGNDGLYVSGAGTKVQSNSGTIVVDAAKGGGTGTDFNNLTGNTALASTTGRWIIYLTHPDNSTFNNLASGNLPIWGQTQSTLAPGSVGAGNRYVFANQPTLTVSTSFSDSKTYGTAYAFPTPARGTNYSISGIISAASYQNVWTQETLSNLGLSGAPEFSSSGAAATANVAGSPYAISIANGTLASSAGYAFGTPSSTGTLTVTPKALSLTGVTALGKTYDGDADADLSGGSLVGIVGSDDVQFSAGSGLFASKNAGTWSVTASGYMLTGGAAGNYTLTQPTVANATITAKALTLSGVTAAGKTYDGDADADLSGGSLVGIIGSDNVEFSAGSGLFASKNAGTWAVTASGYTLTGIHAGNYTLSQPTIANATISPRTLSAGVTATDKTYDGTRDAALTFSTSDIVSGDAVTFAYGAQFADKNAGTGKAVSLTGSVTLSGADAANYMLALDPSDVSALAADISARTLTVSMVGAADKIYDGTTSADLSFTTADILSGDTVTFDYTANFADKTAGVGKGVMASGISLSGADGENYVLVLDNALLAGLSADIERKTLTLDSAAVVDKTYDGNRNVTLDFTTAGLVSGDTVGFLYEALAADGNAGSGKAVTVTGSTITLNGTDADNYDFSFDSALLSGLAIDIAARTLNVTAVTALDKVYDGTTTAALAISATGLVGGDDAVFGFDARFADKTVGAGKHVTVDDIRLSGAAADNYVVVLDPALLGSLSADITAKTLSITDVLALAKTYDGSRGADLAFVTDDIVGGDSVGFGYEALFSDKNAGAGKAVHVTDGAVTLTGADAGNYALSFDAALLLGLSADIGRKTLTVTDVVAVDKTYDGTRNVPLDFTTADILVGDNIAFDYEALVADRNAGSGKTITVGGVSLAGEDAGNYDLALDDSLLSGLAVDVSAKTLTVIVDDQSRAQFQPNPSFTYHLVGLANGDDASVVSGVTLLTTATDAALAGHYAIEASGGSAPNYVLVYTPGTLTVTGHLIPPYDQDRIQHVPGSLSGSDGFGGLVSIAQTPTLHMLSSYAGEATGEAAVENDGAPFCSATANRRAGQRLLPHLQLNMSGRTLYCLGKPSRFVQ